MTIASLEQAYRSEEKTEKSLKERCIKDNLDLLVLSFANSRYVYPYEFYKWVRKKFGYSVSCGTYSPIFKDLQGEGCLSKIDEENEGRKEFTRLRLYSTTDSGKSFLDLKMKIVDSFWQNIDDFLFDYVHPPEEKDEMETLIIEDQLKSKLNLVVLELAKTPIWGYNILKKFGFKLSPGTLYPILKSFVEDGHLQLQLIEEKDGRLRKLYSVTNLGRDLLNLYKNERSPYQTERKRIWGTILFV